MRKQVILSLYDYTFLFLILIFELIVKDDQISGDIDTNQGNKIKSYHLQSDYANLKKIQLELQRAVNDMNSVHSQRFSRYIT